MRGLPYGPGEVAPGSYAQKAIAFGAVAHGDGEDLPVVHKDPAKGSAPQFWCWVVYFESLRRCVGWARTSDRLTVPSDWPWDFSADADQFRGREAAIVAQNAAVQPAVTDARRMEFTRSLQRQAATAALQAREDVFHEF